MSLFDPIFGATAVVAATDDRAWLGALCEVEAALARACAATGVIDAETAARITTAAGELSHSEPGELGRAAAADGNPVIPLVAALRATISAVDRPAVHFGATSQDVLDTASMLVAHRALAGIVADLSACGASCARLAHEHRDTAMAGRTLLQQAVPTTFGALAAVWGTALDRARAGLADTRGGLPVQLGGAAGTLAGLPLDIVAVLAAELGLAAPAGVWHTDRTVVAELAGALGMAAVAIGKVATDVVLLAQTEVGELREQVPGGSSIMAHKQNPIAAITARAGAAQAPGLVSTLLGGTHELQRAAGAWHAEWPALVALLRAVGGAASRLDTCLAGLLVDPTAMARNLGGAAVDTGHAGDLVDRYLDGRGP